MTANTIIAVSSTNSDLADARLSELRREYGNTLTRMCDIYGIGLLMAHYELRVDFTHELGELELDDLILKLATATYTNQLGFRIPPDSIIGIHHRKLEKHIFVHFRKDQDVLVLYHSNDRDAEAEDFVIQVRGRHLASLKPLGQYDYDYELSAKAQDELGMVIDLMQLSKFERADYQLEVPAQHPHSPVREVIAAKILSDFDR